MTFITKYKPDDTVYIRGYFKEVIECKVLDIHIWSPYKSTCMVSYVVEDTDGNKYTVEESSIYVVYSKTLKDIGYDIPKENK